MGEPALPASEQVWFCPGGKVSPLRPPGHVTAGPRGLLTPQGVGTPRGLPRRWEGGWQMAPLRLA